MKIAKLFLVPSLFIFAAAFTACSGSGGATSDASADSTLTQASTAGQIAYVRMDSLMRGYGRFIDLNAAFNDKQEKANKELEAQGRAFEKDYADYQSKTQQGSLTTYQAASAEEALKKKQENLVSYRDRMYNELAEEEANMSVAISVAVMDYLKEYNEEKKYSMIFQTTGGAPILLADPSMDITTEVLAELNKRYLVEIEKQGKK